MNCKAVTTTDLVVPGSFFFINLMIKAPGENKTLSVQLPEERLTQAFELCDRRTSCVYGFEFGAPMAIGRWPALLT